MRSVSFLLLGLSVLGCAAPTTRGNSTAPTPAAAPAGPEAAQVQDVFCLEVFDLDEAPRCAAAVEEAQVTHASGYRLETEDGHVRAAIPIAEGKAPGKQDDVARIDYEYQGDLMIRSVKRAVSGKILREIRVDPEGRRADLWNGYGRRVPETGTSVYSIGLERDASGRIIERRYLDASGKPTPSADGVYTHRYKLDAQGFPVETAAFDGVGNPTRTDDGEHLRRDELNRWGQPETQTFFDLRGNAVVLRSGVHARWFKRDDRGRMDAVTSRDVAGQPVVDRLTGCAALVQVYDSKDLQVGLGCIGPDGQPLKGNLGFSIMVRELDEQNRPKQDTFHDGETPTHNLLGYHRIQYAREGNKFIRFLFDVHGAAPQGKAGGDVSEYDASGFLIMEAEIDHAGHLWGGSQAPQTNYVWERGLEREIRHLSPFKQPAEERGIQLERRTYDNLSQLVKRECFAANGSPVVCAAFRVITFRFSGGERLGKPPPFTRDQALALAKQVQKEVAAGDISMDHAFRKYDPHAMLLPMKEAPQLLAALDSLNPRLKGIVEKLSKGQVSEPDVGTDEVLLVQRTE